jgi:hypothetical protein
MKETYTGTAADALVLCDRVEEGSLSMTGRWTRRAQRACPPRGVGNVLAPARPHALRPRARRRSGRAGGLHAAEVVRLVRSGARAGATLVESRLERGVAGAAAALDAVGLSY